MEEFGTLGWKLNFKDCNRRDAITYVINLQNLWYNT